MQLKQKSAKLHLNFVFNQTDSPKMLNADFNQIWLVRGIKVLLEKKLKLKSSCTGNQEKLF